MIQGLGCGRAARRRPYRQAGHARTKRAATGGAKGGLAHLALPAVAAVARVLLLRLRLPAAAPAAHAPAGRIAVAATALPGLRLRLVAGGEHARHRAGMCARLAGAPVLNNHRTTTLSAASMICSLRLLLPLVTDRHQLMWATVPSCTLSQQQRPRKRPCANGLSDTSLR